MIILVYAVAGIAHSIYLGGISPILLYPWALPVESIVYCFTITEPMDVLLVRVIASAIMTLTLIFLTLHLSDMIHPEIIRVLTPRTIVGEVRSPRRSLGALAWIKPCSSSCSAIGLGIRGLP